MVAAAAAAAVDPLLVVRGAVYYRLVSSVVAALSSLCRVVSKFVWTANSANYYGDPNRI